ncbi:MAG TPA: VOC family protein [Saprospiraceae bacterium]|nr:VOC family protein [Saprospiraceae bacterium]HRO08893.1 VOC family protein [Saprospiraceae bacterium]HRO72558.1 VOC family protein [Saprospiraceae bacterium]HRP42114.1 VOC family protein [Saprospiraceae bacterium]
MATTDTYINFNGNCENAFLFYKSVFGGEFNYLSKFGEMPQGEGYSVPESDLNKVMHVSLPIGKSILMGSDVGGDWAPGFVQGNNFSVSVTADTKEEADHLFDGLSEGRQTVMPMQNTFWGDYFGMLTDKFGINWMVSFNENYQR